MPALGVRMKLAVFAAVITPVMLAGQQIVHESRTAWQAARAIQLVVAQRWCTDANGPGCDMRTMTNAVALPDGGIVVADIAGPLHRFSANGRFVGELSRRGKGPGGFVVGLQLLPSGYLTWFDNTQMRFTSIHLDGTPGPVQRLLPPQTMASINVVGQDLVVLDVPASANVGDTLVATYRTVPATGEPRILGRVRTPSLFRPGSDMRPVPPPFIPSVGPAWRLDVDVPIRHVTAADRDSITSRLLARFKVATAAALPPRERDRLAHSGGTVPPLQAIRVLRDGTVWIRPTSPAGERTARWDVFSRDGSRVGCASLPFTAAVKDGTRNWILVVERGADDVPKVIRYAVGR